MDNSVSSSIVCEINADIVCNLCKRNRHDDVWLSIFILYLNITCFQVVYLRRKMCAFGKNDFVGIIFSDQ